MIASYSRYQLDFRFVARTSREVMKNKATFFLKLHDPETGRTGIGEVALFRGLSAEDTPDFEDRLADFCKAVTNDMTADFTPRSSIIFGFETALLSLQSDQGNDILLPSPFTEGEQAVMINGLVWMDSIERMSEAAQKKIDAGFGCIKFKIGQHDFEKELEMIDRLRLKYGPEQLTIRLDANGAYEAEEAVDKMKRLAPLDIHSVEQPIKARQWDKMAYVCENSPIAIALDEELIGVTDSVAARKMLQYIRPEYVILKPSLCGGLSGAQRWVDVAEALGIGWWVTSALESNVGLNAIAQWTAAMGAEGCQGLGTGALYTNNFDGPLYIDGQLLRFDSAKSFNFDRLEWITP